MKIIWNTSLILGMLLLCGCNSQIDAVNQEMVQIRSQAPQQIEPAPTFSAVPSFKYAAQDLRSPFVPNSMANELKTHSSKAVQPNVHRKKQPLELYALEELYMKGHLYGHDQAHAVALLQTADGQLEQVRVGDYIGQHQGRIVKIGPNQIDLLELMDDGKGGFILRPRSLMLMPTPPSTQPAAPVEKLPQASTSPRQTEPTQQSSQAQTSDTTH